MYKSKGKTRQVLCSQLPDGGVLQETDLEWLFLAGLQLQTNYFVCGTKVDEELIQPEGYTETLYLIKWTSVRLVNKVCAFKVHDKNKLIW